MAKAYSEDLRERVIAAVDAGATRRAAAVQFKVSISSAIRWVRRWQADWEIAAKPRGGSVSPLEDHAAALVALVTEAPDLTLDEFCALLRERKIETSRVSVWRFFSRHGLSFKKNPARQRTGTGGCGGSVGERISPRLRRRAWCLSTRPARPPTWRGPAAAQCAASGSSGGCRTAIGRSPPSLRGCAAAR